METCLPPDHLNGEKGESSESGVRNRVAASVRVHNVEINFFLILLSAYNLPFINITFLRFSVKFNIRKEILCSLSTNKRKVLTTKPVHFPSTFLSRDSPKPIEPVKTFAFHLSSCLISQWRESEKNNVNLKPSPSPAL